MCGLAGFLAPGGMDAEQGMAIAVRMQAALLHRGPDGAGAWSDPQSGLFIAHRRLAVLDPGPTGAQPMQSASGRYILIFNGEIYNHLDLRRDLQLGGHNGQWRGRSDSETLLAAIEAWGLVPALQRAAGMFALAV